MTATPAEIPDTTPVALTVATDVAEDVQLPPDRVSVNVVVLPAHKIAVPVILPAVNGAPTVMVEDAVLLQPLALYAVTVYVAEPDNVATTEAAVVLESPVAGDHEYTAPPVAVRVEVPLPHKTGEDEEMEIVGAGFTTIVTFVTAVQP